MKKRKEKNSKGPTLAVGAFVRIPKEKRAFSKGYKSRWTSEIFRISGINRTTPVTYVLRDLKGEIIIGGFYRKELNPCPLPGQFAIGKILDEKNDKYLIKYRDYPAKFNRWVRSGLIKSP